MSLKKLLMLPNQSVRKKIAFPINAKKEKGNSFLLGCKSGLRVSEAKIRIYID